MRMCKLLLIGLFFASSVLGQESKEPTLSGFETLVRRCEDAESVVDSERKRLGAKFEKDLLTYLGDDAEKHFKVACNLSNCCRKENDNSLELLSLLIRQQALSLLHKKTDQHSLYQKVTLHMLAAVQSEQLGFHTLAIAHKSEAEWLVSWRPILRGGFPALTEEGWKLYESLPKQALPIKKSEKGRRR